jgi:hypothetical protein
VLRFARVNSSEVVRTSLPPAHHNRSDKVKT